MMLQSLKAVVRELYSLFVDDGSFAVAIIVWLALLWLARPYLHLTGAASALLMAGGLIAILIESTLRRARR